MAKQKRSEVKFPEPPCTPKPPTVPPAPRPPGSVSETLDNDMLGKLIKKLGDKSLLRLRPDGITLHGNPGHQPPQNPVTS